ncbi:MAG: NAD(P)/FAD-dependent oxidoreductase, partial [Alphaproteobacteria bacterium]
AGRLGELGYPVERVDRRGLAELAPDVRFAEGARGLLAPRDRCLDVPRAVRFLADRVRALGGRVIEHTPVNGFTRAGGRVATVETYGGSIATHHAVIAAGAATPRLAALAAGGAPALPVGRVQGLLVDVPPDVVSHRVAHTVHTPERGGLHFRPRADGGLMICAEDTAEPLAALEDVNDAIALKADLLRRAQAFLPALDGEAVGRRATARIGVRPMPGDGYSIVGWVPGADGVIAAVTHSGVTLGLVLGRLIAEAVMDGRMPERLARYGLDRF